MSLQTAKRREQVSVDQYLGDEASANQSKNLLKSYVQSKEFKSNYKQLDADQKRLILLSSDNEYLDMLQGKIKQKAEKVYKKQKILLKKRIGKEQTDKIEKKQNSIFQFVKNAFKNIEESQKENCKKEVFNQSQQCLSIPLISEDSAIKILAATLFFEEQVIQSSVFNSVLLNPFNFIRLFGLVWLVASKLLSKKPLNIELIDSLFTNISELNAQDFHINGKNDDEKRDNLRNNLLRKCTQIISHYFLKSSLGIKLLQFEEIIIFKDMELIEYLQDRSLNKYPKYNEVFANNMLDEKSFDLELVQFKNISFSSTAYQIVQNSKNELIASFEKMVLKIVLSINIPSRLGSLKIDEQYGKSQLNLNSNRDEKMLLNSSLELLKIMEERIIKTRIRVGENPKNQIFQGFNGNQYCLPIVSETNNKIIRFSQKKVSLIRTQILEHSIKFFIYQGEAFSQRNSALVSLIELEACNSSQFLNLSETMFQTYKIIFSEVLSDVMKILSAYKQILKNKYGKDIIDESDFENNDSMPNPYDLKMPINLILKNIQKFYKNFSESFSSNSKLFLHSEKFILPLKMLNYYKEYTEKEQNQGEDKAKIWWKIQENQERSSLRDEIKVAWLDDEKPLVNIYQKYFQFCNLCISFQKCYYERLPCFYPDLIACLKNFAQTYEYLFNNESNKQENLFEASQFVVNENEIELPVFRKILTKIENDPLNKQDAKAFDNLSNQRKSSVYEIDEGGNSEIEKLKNILLLNFISLYGSSNQKIWTKVICQSNFSKSNIEKKIQYLKIYSKYENQKRQSCSYVDMQCTISRDRIWDSFFSFISKIPPYCLFNDDIDIKFEGEKGIDGGGLSREFFSHVFKDLLDPNKGFFSPSSNKITMQPNPFSTIIPDHLLHFKYAGRLLAKSIFCSYSCEVDFTRSFLKHILGLDLYISDLEDIDPELTKNLLWVLDNDITDLNLDFSYQITQLGKQHIFELKPNGSKIEVNEENKKEYVKLMAAERMTKQIEKQIKAFQEGFYEIIPFQAIKVLTVSELGFKISGEHEINLEELKQNIILDDFTKESQQIMWLFEILEGYNQEQLAGFIFFITGSFRVPFGGFKNHKIEISKKSGNQSLPVSHTCSRNLELPVYETKQIMEEKLETAVVEGSKGFYIG